MDSLSDPADVLDREDVPVRERTKVYGKETFEALRERYEAIDGVVMVGLTTDRGVLLMASDAWFPPGGEVDPGMDWVTAARNAMADLTGVDIEIDALELVEPIEFRLEGDADSRFSSYAVHFSASLAEESPSFVEDPTIADDFSDNADDEDLPTLQWFDEVPADADQSHEYHIGLYVD